MKIVNTIFSDSQTEIVEKKSKADPDNMCSLLSEYICQTMSTEYGSELNFLDFSKSIVIGGESQPMYTGGEIMQPITYICSGIINEKLGKKRNEYLHLLNERVYEYLHNNYRFLHKRNFFVENKVVFRSDEELSYFPNKNICITVYRGKTLLERIVSDISAYIESSEVRSTFIEIGDDIRVYGVRKNNSFYIDIFAAFVDLLIKNENDFEKKRQEILAVIKNYVQKKYSENIEISFNSNKESSSIDEFLTVTGTFLEKGGLGGVRYDITKEGMISYSRPYLYYPFGKSHLFDLEKIYHTIIDSLVEEIYQRVRQQITIKVYTLLNSLQVEVASENISAREQHWINSLIEQKLKVVDYVK